MPEITEYRVGRNYIRQGDRVHIRKGWNGSKNGFDSRVIKIRATASGEPEAVDVKHPATGHIRTVRVALVERKAQTRGRQVVEVR